jgi:antitoxin VapB
VAGWYIPFGSKVYTTRIAMALYIKNREAEALAREIAAERAVGVTEVVLSALRNERKRRSGESLVEWTKAFHERVRAIGNPEKGLPADKAFIDSLYED